MVTWRIRRKRSVFLDRHIVSAPEQRAGTTHALALSHVHRVGTEEVHDIVHSGVVPQFWQLVFVRRGNRTRQYHGTLYHEPSQLPPPLRLRREVQRAAFTRPARQTDPRDVLTVGA